MLERLLADAGLTPLAAGEVAVLYAPPDRTSLERVRRAIVDGAEPFRLADGSYLFRNSFRYVVAGRG